MKNAIDLVAALEAALEMVEQHTVTFEEENALIVLSKALSAFQAKVA
jgi:hypothetical protein